MRELQKLLPTWDTTNTRDEPPIPAKQLQTHALGRMTTRVHMSMVFLFWRNSPTRVRAASFLRFPDHAQWRSSVGRTLWTRDRHIVESCTWEHTTHNIHTYIHPSIHSCAPDRIRTRNFSKWSVSDLQIRPPCHWDRHPNCYNKLCVPTGLPLKPLHFIMYCVCVSFLGCICTCTFCRTVTARGSARPDV